MIEEIEETFNGSRNWSLRSLPNHTARPYSTMFRIVKVKMTVMNDLNAEQAMNGVQKLQERWKRAIESEGSYF